MSYGWDGTFKGENVAEGVYVFVAQVANSENENRVITGDITIIR